VQNAHLDRATTTSWDAAVEAEADGDAPVGLDPVGAGLAQALSNMLVPNAAEPYSRNLRLPN